MNRKIIVKDCRECPHCDQFYHWKDTVVKALFCNEKQDVNSGLIGIISHPKTEAPCPKWCPLPVDEACDTTIPCQEGNSQYEPQMSTRQEGWILDGMPGIEWASENLTGHGGTEVNGNWYYTWNQAMAAAAEVGNGWRLPTEAELEQLCELQSTCDAECKGRWFGADLYLANNLFLPAAGYLTDDRDHVMYLGSHGYYWSSAPSSVGPDFAGNLLFYSSNVCPHGASDQSARFTVRFVRCK